MLRLVYRQSRAARTSSSSPWRFITLIAAAVIVAIPLVGPSIDEAVLLVAAPYQPHRSETTQGGDAVDTGLSARSLIDRLSEEASAPAVRHFASLRAGEDVFPATPALPQGSGLDGLGASSDMVQLGQILVARQGDDYHKYELAPSTEVVSVPGLSTAAVFDRAEGLVVMLQDDVIAVVSGASDLTAGASSLVLVDASMSRIALISAHHDEISVHEFSDIIVDVVASGDRVAISFISGRIRVISSDGNTEASWLHQGQMPGVSTALELSISRHMLSALSDGQMLLAYRETGGDEPVWSEPRLSTWERVLQFDDGQLFAFLESGQWTVLDVEGNVRARLAAHRIIDVHITARGLLAVLTGPDAAEVVANSVAFFSASGSMLARSRFSPVASTLSGAENGLVLLTPHGSRRLGIVAREEAGVSRGLM